MGKAQKKHGKGRLDKYYRTAKEKVIIVFLFFFFLLFFGHNICNRNTNKICRVIVPVLLSKSFKSMTSLVISWKKPRLSLICVLLLVHGVKLLPKDVLSIQ